MKRTGLLLLVEDDPDQADLARRALLKAGVGLQTVVAYDGRQALDYLLAQGHYHGRDAAALPDIILLDLKLPEIDGFQVLKQIREHQAMRHIPVLILSCSDQEHDMAASYALGANGYIRKPVDFSDFVEAVRAVGRFVPISEPSLFDCREE